MPYIKNIAIIRELKSGFSADGGKLSGLIKAEKYGSQLKVEATLINFAPLTDGAYVVGISDGVNCCILDGTIFEGSCAVDTSAGFGALICFVKNGVFPVASAVSGNFNSATFLVKQAIEEKERLTPDPLPTIKQDNVKYEYEDEALAQENYYEYEQTDKDGGTVCENKETQKIGQRTQKNETASRPVEEGQGGLAGGCFYELMADEIQKILTSHPKENDLCRIVENSDWVKITYGEGKYYVFGIIYGGGNPQYICYGVPTKDSLRPPESMTSLASFIPSNEEETEGYWVMYQDAKTGVSIKIDRV